MKSGLWVNPGRKPTPIGGDGILPYVLVPHWAGKHVAGVLEGHGIEFELEEGWARSVRDRVGPDDDDRFTFPRAEAEFVQKIVDAIRITPPGSSPESE